MLLAAGVPVSAPRAAHGPPLRSLAEPIGLHIGTSVSAEVGSRRDIVTREFSMVTPENAMKWVAVHPEPGVYDFRWADLVVAMAQQNGMQVRGHTLAWDKQLPRWIAEGAFSKEEWIRILHDHIATVMGHYRTRFPGVVTQWDVVNEAIADCPGPAPCGLRDSPWLRGIGPEYVELAFRFAREADPAAKLYYNDYGSETGDDAGKAKTAAMMNMLKILQADHVPIDGVGLQFHTGGDGPQPSDLVESMKRVADLNLDVAVTELDVGIPPIATGAMPDRAAFDRQAATYDRVLEACLEQARCHTFTVWGLSDATSWRAPAFPCIYDRDLKPKPAYFALRDRLAHNGRDRTEPVHD
jgi:endo-1,4-beta-xylanase